MPPTEPVTEVAGESHAGDDPCIPITDARQATVGGTRVRRALPLRTRRTIGAWCFADHIGPADVTNPTAAGIGPHPHIGLQTVTWLLDGELRHLDSLGSDQLVRPGQLNLMTAGGGIAHAEEWHGGQGPYHGIQLWVAQPEATRHGPPAFEHHDELPRVELDDGASTATVLIGDFADARSPARHDTDHFGAELRLRPDTSATSVPVNPTHEHGIIVLDGAVTVCDTPVQPGQLAYLEPGRDEIPLHADTDTIAMLIGGVPFDAKLSMWWNFVGRDHDEITQAQQAWNAHDTDRFGPVESALSWIAAPEVPWSS